ncbi:MAG: type II toxin-antitoxin system VapC family toxin [Desulfuromonadales bacterium]
MKKIRIYVDTSVIGGCLDHEFMEWSNGLLQDFIKGIYLPVLSELTIREAASAPLQVQSILASFRKCNVEIVQVTPEMQELADAYLQHNIVTRKFEDDALHIAIATVCNADIVVSWNFRHIVRFEKIQRFNAVNLEMGYKTIAIHSPMEVTSYGNQSS